MKRAFLFPGQGTQVVGMGKDIYEKYEEEMLNQTKYTQIAILTTSLAILEVLKSNNIKAEIAVGLSLGEYVALIYAGIISFEDGIRLIQKRGYCMETLVPDEKYSMAAVIGLDSSKIEEVCNEMKKQGKFVVPANYNCQVQTAISGKLDAIDETIEKLKKAGAKRIIKLNTSGPFHTSELKAAKEAYSKELEKISFNQINEIKVIKNIDGTYYQEKDNIKEILANHIISPVRFDKAIKLMEKEKVEEYVEIGPGKTLTGFVKKDNKEANIVNINSLETLENYINKEK